MSCVYNGENMCFDRDLNKVDYSFLLHLFKSEQRKGSELFEQKNVRYEASFFKQCEEDGDLSSAVIRLKDKVNRFSALVKNPDIDCLDESVKDTLTDLANYATMCLVFLEVKEIQRIKKGSPDKEVISENADQ